VSLLKTPLRLLLLVMGLLAMAQGAHAACISPAGTAGDIRYASNYGVMVFCNDQNWVSMAGGVSVTVNTAGGGATPAGATNDVQFNSSGALSADTGNFTYSAGLLTAPNLNTGNVSATTINATGIGTMGSLLVAGGATVTGQASITTVSTSLIQIGNNGAACTFGLAGAQRYNSTSNTIDYCTGTAWMSLGPSTTLVPAFMAYGNSTETVAHNTPTKLTTFGAVGFDTNNNFASNTFTVSVPGVYLITAAARFPATTASGSGYVMIYKNGFAIQTNSIPFSGNVQSINDTAIVKASPGDYFEIYVQQTSGSALTMPSARGYTMFAASLITTNGGSSGSGTANPAGTTNDIQFNTSGSFDADTGKFVWDKTNHRLGIGLTPGYDLDVSGSGASTNIGFGRNSYGDVRVEVGASALGNHNSYIDLTGDTTYTDYGLRIIRGADSSSQIAHRGTGNLYIQTIDQAPIVFRTSSTNSAIIDSAGNVGIGTSNPVNTLDVSGTERIFYYGNTAGYYTPWAVAVGNNSSGSNYSRLAAGQISTNSMFLEAADQSNTKGTLMLQPYGGYVTVNSTASPTYVLTVGGDIYATSGWLRTAGSTGWYNQTNGGGWYMTDSTYIRNYGSKQVYLNANIYAPAFLYTSDKRLKTDIAPLTGGLAKLDSLNPVSFRFISDTSVSGTAPHPLHIGVIAQDVQKVYPQAVHADAKGMLSVDYPALVGPILDMLKEMKGIVFGDHDAIAKLQAANDNLRIELKAEHDARVSQTAALKASNDNLQASLEALEKKMRAHGW
jgi:hypothetical protein